MKRKLKKYPEDKNKPKFPGKLNDSLPSDNINKKIDLKSNIDYGNRTSIKDNLESALAAGSLVAPFPLSYGLGLAGSAIDLYDAYNADNERDRNNQLSEAVLGAIPYGRIVKGAKTGTDFYKRYKALKGVGLLNTGVDVKDVIDPNMKYAQGGTINMKKRTLKKYGLAGLVNKDGNPTQGGQMAMMGATTAANVIGNLATGASGKKMGSDIGAGIGAVGGQALNAVVPGLGLVAAPVLSAIGGWAGGAIGETFDDKPDMAKIQREQDEMNNFNNNNRGWSNTFKTSNSFTFAQGGLVIDGDEMNPTAELELNEQFQLPDGQVGEVDGPSHAEGGIEANLPDGTRIFSDRLKHNGRTFAKVVKPINSKIAKLDKELEANPNDKLKQNSKMLLNKQLDHYFDVQETNKQNIEMKRTLKYAKGGLVKYWAGGPFKNEEEFVTGSDPYYKTRIDLQNQPTQSLENNWNLPSIEENIPLNQGIAIKPKTIKSINSPANSISIFDQIPTASPISQNSFLSTPKSQEPSLPKQPSKFGNFMSNNAGEIGQIGSSLLTAGLQNRNVNRLQRPRTLGKVNLTGKMANPNLVDYSAQRNAIDQGYLASADSAQRNLSNSATAQAFKNQANLARLQGTGESWQNQENTNAQIRNQFLGQRNQAAMQEEMLNNEIDKYNLEGVYGFDQNKLGLKNQLISQVGNTAGQVFGNRSKYQNQLDQANILANQYDPSVLNDMIKNGKLKLVDGKLVRAAYGGTVRSFANGGQVGEKYRQALQTKATVVPETIDNAQAMDAEYASYLDDKGMPIQNTFKSSITGLEYKVLPKAEKRLLAANMWKEAHGTAPTKKQEEATVKAIEGKKVSSSKAKDVASMFDVWPEANLSQSEKNMYEFERNVKQPIPLMDKEGNFRSEAIESQGSLIEDFITPEGIVKLGGAALAGLGMGYMKKKAMTNIPKLGKEVLEGKVKRTIIDDLGKEGYEEAVKKGARSFKQRQTLANKKRLSDWNESGSKKFLDESTSPEFRKKLTKRITDSEDEFLANDINKNIVKRVSKQEDEMLPYDMMNKKLNDMEIPSFKDLKTKEMMKDLEKAKKTGDIQLWNKIMKEMKQYDKSFKRSLKK